MTDNIDFLTELETVIRTRRTASGDKSYTKTLFNRGTPYIAQKVGEEAVELAIAAVQGDKGRTISEAADLMYHILVLLEDNDLNLSDLAAELAARHND
ncbi:MAG: phosphoribosyl-ATP diphosphatase [Gammaproteobacteria bacterium]|nr:phosphoribosyl-ATP diphosphatase [Gammaproteobacteria bacterium]MCP4275649.1 phosphoribosyl-ATP diphosphatase [Gammaproteobacteria bacterium]MCP4831362.1 phosphoribosyl-ATP diphosphatase [Gammaproteobacteria bacterium]MCP4927681.1 phosphoribosyl-ATP diphosphatase [Gammaproteobacteria bacterium]